MSAAGRPLAVVAGGSGAIGAAAVELLTERGYDVIATRRKTAEPGAVPVAWVGFDATAPDATADLAAAVGARPVQAVVFAIGVPSSKYDVAVTEPGEFAELFTVNALALALVWQALAEPARAGAARVLVLSSDTTRSAGAGNGPYTASKAALEAIALTLAKEEAAHGVRVNVLAPSLVDSPQARIILDRKGVTDVTGYFAGLPGGRPLTVAEAAGLAVSIATDDPWAHASGQIIRLAPEAGAR